MEYVRPCYNYKYWMWLFQYMQSMQRYVVISNYIKLRDNNQIKGENMYIDGRPKDSENIVDL